MTLARGVAVGGGTALLAVWLVSVVSTGAPSPRIRGEPPDRTRVQPPFQFDAQMARLRPRASAPAPPPAPRNPFTFGRDRQVAIDLDGSTSRHRADDRLAGPAEAEAIDQPLSLIGIAERKSSAGVQRVAILSGAGQLYLAAVGDAAGPDYVVDAIDTDAVDLVGETGRRLHLALR
jgi:hypothetical protein